MLVASPANFVIIDIISCRVLEVLRPFEKKQKQLLHNAFKQYIMLYQKRVFHVKCMCITII